jgi:hypothetical protein
LYFIECNYDEFLYEYYKGSTIVWVLRWIYCCIVLNINHHEWLDEKYEGSIVVLYWKLNCYGMFVGVLQRI